MGPSPYESATGYAGVVQTRSDLRWLDLELAAFSRHPEVQRALRRDAASAQEHQARTSEETPGHRRFRWLRVAWILLLIVQPVLVAFYSITGEGKGNNGSFVAAEDALPRAGVLVTVAAAALLVLVVVDRARTRRSGEASGGVALLAVLTSVAMIVMVIVGGIRGGGNDVAHWALWLVPLLAYLLVAIYALVSIASGPAVKNRGPSAAELAEDLPADERDRISADLARAVKDLARRGVITEREAELADDELGDLTVTMVRRAAAKRSQSRKKG